MGLFPPYFSLQGEFFFPPPLFRAPWRRRVRASVWEKSRGPSSVVLSEPSGEMRVLWAGGRKEGRTGCRSLVRFLTYNNLLITITSISSSPPRALCHYQNTTVSGRILFFFCFGLLEFATAYLEIGFIRAERLWEKVGEDSNWAVLVCVFLFPVLHAL